jgi:bacillithiol biosynthesis deacetylase BshB1
VGAPTDLDVLAIAAHPDDIEITCGGLLIKMGNLGRKTGALDLTRGEMGTYGDAMDRTEEASQAARVMGLAYRHQLDIPDSAVEYTQDNKLKIAQIVRAARPELVILPHWEQRHPDHLACSLLGYDACFLAGLKKASLQGEPFRPRKIIYVSYFRNSDYSFLVDISEEFGQKTKAVAAYQSQFGEAAEDMASEILTNRAFEEYGARGDQASNVFHPGVNIFELMYIRARQLGLTVGVQFAEAYTVREQMLIDDPQNMPVRSI